MKAVLLSKYSGFQLPVTKRVARPDEPIEVVGKEAEKVVSSGKFRILPEGSEDALLSHSSPPMNQIPEDWTGMNIAVTSKSGIGDALLSSFVVPVLKQKDCHIEFFVPDYSIPFLSCIRKIDKVSKIEDLQEKNFSVVLNLTEYMKENAYKVRNTDAVASLFYASGIDGYSVSIPSLAPQRLSPQMKGLIGKYKTIAVIHPYSNGSHKMWDLDQWESVVEELEKREIGCFIVGKDPVPFDDKNGFLVDCTSFGAKEQIELVRQANYFLGIDSCFCQIAGMARKQSIVLYGPTVKDTFSYWYDTVYPVYSQSDCAGCNYVSSDKCKYNFKCMEKITFEQVMNTIDYVTRTPAQRRKRDKNKEDKPSVPEESQKSKIDVLYRKEKVGIFFPWSILGGAEVSTLELARGLEKFFDVSIFVSRQNKESHSGIFDSEIEKDFDVHYVDTANDLQSAISDTSIDVLLWYGVFELCPTALSNMKNRPRSIRVLHTSYDKEGRDYIKKWNSVIDKVVAVNPDVSESLNSLVDSCHIPNPAPEKVRDIERIPDKEFTLGYIGRLDDNKNIKFIIKASKHLKGKLLIKPSPSPQMSVEDVQSIAQDYGVGDKVELLEQSADVSDFYSRIHGLVLASKEEGLPMCILEAGLLGIPVMSTEVGALPRLFPKEIVFFEKSKSGIPLMESFKEALSKLTPAKGRKLNKKVEKISNCEVVANQYKRTIREVIGKGLPSKIQNGVIAAKRDLGAGDAIMAFSPLRKFREMLPNAEIKFETKLVDVNSLFQTMVGVECVEEVKDYDYQIVLEYNKCYEQQKHIIEGFGASPCELAFDTSVFPKRTRRNKKYVGIFPSQNPRAKKKTKEWPYWKELVELLVQDKRKVFQFGSLDDELVSDNVVDARSDNLSEIVLNMWDMNGIITIDNVGIHLSKAMEMPCVALFGKSSFPWLSSYSEVENLVAPYEEECMISVSQSNRKAKGCNPCVDGSGYAQCMRAIDVETVRKSVNKDILI